MRSRASQTFLRLFFLHSLVVALGCFLIERRFHFGLRGTDDANIFFGYADNVLAGYGLVYSPGGDAVEGFTSALWLAICTYARLSKNHSELTLLLVNGALAAGTLSLVSLGTGSALRRLGLGQVIAPVAVLLGCLALAHPAWLLWNVSSLMDCGLYTFCLTFAWFGFHLLRIGDRRAITVLGWSTFLLIVCRPEGIGWFLLLVVGCFAVGKWGGACARLVSEARRRVVLCGGATCGALLTWRWFTFRATLPNPLYAKVSAPLPRRLELGAAYLRTYLELHTTLLALVATVLVLASVVWFLPATVPSRGTVVRKGRVHAALVEALVSVGFVSAAWCVPLVAGGDVFGGHRFCQVVHLLLVPPLAIGLGIVVRRSLWLVPRPLPNSVGLRVVIALSALAPLLSMSSQWTQFGYSNGEPGGAWLQHEHFRSEFIIAEADRLHGERIAETLAPRFPRLAYAAAGGISVGYPGVVYDMMGLNDPVIARRCSNKVGPTGHACFDRERFYELHPDALLPRAVESSTQVNLPEVERLLRRPGSWDNIIFRDLFNESRFQEQYRMVRISSSQRPWSVYGYFSVQYLLELALDAQYRLVFP